MKLKTIDDWLPVIASIIIGIYLIILAHDWSSKNLTVGEIPAKQMLELVGGIILIIVFYNRASKSEKERERRRIIKDSVGEVLDERKQ